MRLFIKEHLRRGTYSESTVSVATWAYQVGLYHRHYLVAIISGDILLFPLLVALCANKQRFNMRLLIILIFWPHSRFWHRDDLGPDCDYILRDGEIAF